MDDLPEREEQAERPGDDDAVYSQRILRMSQRGRVEVQIERHQRGDQAHGQRGDLSGVVDMRITSLFLQFCGSSSILKRNTHVNYFLIKLSDNAERTIISHKASHHNRKMALPENRPKKLLPARRIY